MDAEDERLKDEKRLRGLKAELDALSTVELEDLLYDSLCALYPTDDAQNS